jgi:hypothetical protein
MVEKFPNLMKNFNIKIQETQWTSNSIKQIHTSKHYRLLEDSGMWWHML